MEAKDLKVGDSLPNFQTGFGEYKNRIVDKIEKQENSLLWVLISYEYFSFDGRHRKGKSYLTNKPINPSFNIQELI